MGLTGQAKKQEESLDKTPGPSDSKNPPVVTSAVCSPCWLGSRSAWLFLTVRSSGPSWSAMRSLLRTGFCAEAAVVIPPVTPLLTTVPLGLRAGPGTGEGDEEEADDGGGLGAALGPDGERGARDAALGRLWSFMMPLGSGGSSWVVFEVYSAANWRIIRCIISRATRGMWGSVKLGRSVEKTQGQEASY